MITISRDTRSVTIQNHRVYYIPCPVDCKRDLAAFLEAVGDAVLVDGKQHHIIGLETFLPATPLHAGETVGIMIDQ